MDEVEARQLAEEALAPLRSLPYDQLVAEYLNTPHASLVRGSDGEECNLEVEAVWESRKKKTLRVVACVDDGVVRGGFFTVEHCADFILAPDGSFVGE